MAFRRDFVSRSCLPPSRPQVILHWVFPASGRRLLCSVASRRAFRCLQSPSSLSPSAYLHPGYGKLAGRLRGGKQVRHALRAPGRGTATGVLGRRREQVLGLYAGARPGRGQETGRQRPPRVRWKGRQPCSCLVSPRGHGPPWACRIPAAALPARSPECEGILRTHGLPGRAQVPTSARRTCEHARRHEGRPACAPRPSTAAAVTGRLLDGRVAHPRGKPDRPSTLPRRLPDGGAVNEAAAQNVIRGSEDAGVGPLRCWERTASACATHGPGRRLSFP